MLKSLVCRLVGESLHVRGISEEIDSQKLMMMPQPHTSCFPHGRDRHVL